MTSVRRYFYVAVFKVALAQILYGREMNVVRDFGFFRDEGLVAARVYNDDAELIRSELAVAVSVKL